MRHLVRSLAATVLVASLGCSDSATGPSSSTLTPGVPRSINGAEGSEREFRVVVPAGTGSLRVALTGGTGDADLYLRFGSAPIPSAFDCGSDSFGEDEECHFDNPTAGTWYIVVVGFEAYSNVSLIAELGTGTGAEVLTSGVPVTDLFGGAGSRRHFRIDVSSAGTSTLTVTTADGSGDLDLFVRRGALATVFVNDCASVGDFNTEQCVLPAAAGTYYILVAGFSTYDDATLTATIAASLSAGGDGAVRVTPDAGWVKQAIGR